jgi:hypothetical protein
VGKINKEVGEGAIKVRNPTRSVKPRLIEIAKSTRVRDEEFKERKAKSYRRPLGTTKKVVMEAKAILGQAQTGLKKRVNQPSVSPCGNYRRSWREESKCPRE